MLKHGRRHRRCQRPRFAGQGSPGRLARARTQRRAAGPVPVVDTLRTPGLLRHELDGVHAVPRKGVGRFVVHDGQRIVAADDASGHLLHQERRALGANEIGVGEGG